jgi:hypothetical protein
MTEEDLDAAVVQLCDELGLITLHVREPGREGGEWAGFPDRVIYGPNRPYVLYRELKTRTGVSAGQKRWRWRLAERFHQDYAVWRASDWSSGRIAEQLAALAGKDIDVTPAAGDEEDPGIAVRRRWEAALRAGRRPPRR